jgi:hypothetical protein
MYQRELLSLFPQGGSERKVAVAVVIAMKEPAFLIAVQWIVSGIEIKRDLARGLIARIVEQLEE